MANKNLVRRAFSVTANLPGAAPISSPPQTPEATSVTSLPTAVEPLQASSSSVSAAPAAFAAPPAAPRTGPGSMLAFMTEQSEVHREVVQLRERVASFDGADVTRRMDPASITASRWANREVSHFETDAFSRLKDEIASAGGNIQPIKIRPLAVAARGGPLYEIVYGHRRHRACLELGIPVLALVQQDMKDADLFVEMERENRNREDLSAWEQGVMYMRALEQGLFPSAKQLAAAIDRDMGNISRAMALAKLPAAVVAAFGSPLNLQFRWATPLKDAHQRDPEGLLEAARELVQRNPPLTPAEVFAVLTKSGAKANSRSGGKTQWSDDKETPVATLTHDRKGRVVVSIDRPMDDVQRQKLVKLLDGFLGIKS